MIAPVGTSPETQTEKNADVFLPEHVRSRLLQNQSIQMLPWLAVKAVKMAEDPDCSMNEFTAIVERDVSLVSGILSLANSVFYSSGKPLANVRQAVIRLGVRTCRNLILSSCITSLMSQMSMKQEWIRETLARHGFFTAVLAQNLNRALSAGFDGEEFTAGLVHDIGRTLLASCYVDEFLEFDSMEFTEDLDYLDREASILGTTHASVGAWYATNSGLPESLVAVVRYHHRPLEAEANRRLVALIAVADHMANYAQRFENASEYDFSANPYVSILEETGVNCAPLMEPGVAAQHLELAEDAVAKMSSLK